MRRVVMSALTILLLTAAPSPARAGDGARGSARAEPSAYSWLDADVPADTYTIIYVTGLSAAEVTQGLGSVQKELGTVTRDRVERYQSHHTDTSTYTAPLVAQVQEHGRGVVAYLSFALVDDATVAALSSRGTAASFFTDVELDTYVTIARRGEVVRQFDAGFRPPAAGALPEENGLDWGTRRQNVFATAWAFLERLTRIHVSQRWFDRAHPAFVYREQTS